MTSTSLWQLLEALKVYFKHPPGSEGVWKYFRHHHLVWKSVPATSIVCTASHKSDKHSVVCIVECLKLSKACGNFLLLECPQITSFGMVKTKKLEVFLFWKRFNRRSSRYALESRSFECRNDTRFDDWIMYLTRVVMHVECWFMNFGWYRWKVEQMSKCAFILACAFQHL